MAVLVELKARFDEATNVNWAKQLERAGVHVVYGMVGLKTHSKCVLVVRDDGDQLRRYCHIGTGNYNSKTARALRGPRHPHVRHRRSAPTSPSCSTTSPATAATTDYHTLLVAPTRPAPAAARADRARGRPTAPDGRITIKANSIADAEMIERAVPRQPGRRADRPGDPRHLLPARRVPGLSDTIRVRSILGRYLEHSRIYRFAHGEVDGSADLPHRVRRPHAAQPRSPRRGARADRAPEAPGMARHGARDCSSPTTSCAGNCSPTTPGSAAGHSTRSSRTPSRACTGGWSSASSPSARPEPRRTDLFARRSPAVHPRPFPSSPPFPRLRDEAAPPPGPLITTS